MKKILFIKLLDASFVRLDEEILREHYHILEFRFKYRKGWRVITELLREAWFVIRYVWTSDLIYIWFADFHAVIPSLIGRLLGKRVVIVVGGYDAAYRPDLGYGVKTRLIGSISASCSLKMASHLIPVSRFTLNEMISNFGNKLQSKSHVIYNCYNPVFNIEKADQKDNSVITICLADSEKTLKIKGVDFFLSVAGKLPEFKFIVVGLTQQALSSAMNISSSNVQFIGKIPQDKLADLLRTVKVICQFSRHESFGVALLEGIASGCFPVAFHDGGPGEILQDHQGILIKEPSVGKGVEAIREAMKMTPGSTMELQKYISEKFSPTARQTAIISFINTIL
jgi:glycosyltransferase involved in cell wall biosynthesis